MRVSRESVRFFNTLLVAVPNDLSYPFSYTDSFQWVRGEHRRGAGRQVFLRILIWAKPERPEIGI